MRRLILSVMIMLAFSLSAFALTGSGDSGTVALETVAPSLQSVSAETEKSLSATFSEAMLKPGVTTPGNYGVSGLGVGTLSPSPDSVLGTGPYTLSWSAGEMQDGVSITVTATGLQDAVGNPVNPAHNSASCAGLGVAPVFTNLAANPAQASVGERVTITFTCSEALDGAPDMTVNGHAATRVSGDKALDFTYEYEVQSGDPLGAASLSVTGLDPAGNLGSFSSDAALEIVEEEAGLPLHAWPAGLALLAAGIVLLARKKRGLTQAKRSGDVSVPAFWFLIAAALLASSAAFAQAPTVSNVTFSQSPNATTTQVDIYYDLVAPNGPCDITVSLSKDGGAEGYTHPVAHCTGDIANVTTGTGKHIVWDIRADYPEEDIPNARIRVTADDGLVQHVIGVTSSGNGTVSGGGTYDHGETVTLLATPDTGCHFVNWTEGGAEISTDPACSFPATSARTLVGNFAINTYAIGVTSGGNGTVGGGGTYNHGAMVTLSATPDPNHYFVNWTEGGAHVSMDPAYSFTATAPRTLVGNFAINRYYIAVTSDGHGAVGGGGAYDHGAIVTLSATPDPGYRFVNWTAYGFEVSTDPAYSYTATGSRTLVGNFAINTYTLTYAINGGAVTTTNPVVTLNNTCVGSPTQYMASESASFTGATWQNYATGPSFTLSFGVGTRTVYFKVRNGMGESGVVSDTIFVEPNTVSVAAGTFTMGRTAGGDDATFGATNEDPQHSVTLGAYQLGKGEVTNKEYCDVLNWALAQGYLYADAAGTPWADSVNIYAGGTAASRYLAVYLGASNILYSGGVFTPKTRVGLPGTTNYPTDTHPVVSVSWYGSVAFCNWLSEWQGLTPCYDMNTALWPLTVAPPTSGGYRLSTEAEWERAAAWDGSKHWIYGFISDMNPGSTANRCNDRNPPSTYDNPLGLTATPYTSPVMWFNGVNVSPNGSVATVNSPSPVGAYDMTGNVWEWCHDWYLDTYYNGGSMTNPTGPGTGSTRVLRGGGWASHFFYARSASRSFNTPTNTYDNTGFRLAR